MKKILLVENDDILSGVICGALASAGFSVEVEQEGERAFVKMHQFVPDLIILDILLPGMSGWDFLARSRADLGCFCQKVPALILTNVTTGGDDYGKAVKLGAVDYLVKANFSPGQIVSKIKKILSV